MKKTLLTTLLLMLTVVTTVSGSTSVDRRRPVPSVRADVVYSTPTTTVRVTTGTPPTRYRQTPCRYTVSNHSHRFMRDGRCRYCRYTRKEINHIRKHAGRCHKHDNGRHRGHRR